MIDGIYPIHCDRPGCNAVVGVQRYENGSVVEEEWEPGVEVTEEGNTYCSCCKNMKDVFRTPEDMQKGELC